MAQEQMLSAAANSQLIHDTADSDKLAQYFQCNQFSQCILGKVDFIFVTNIVEEVGEFCDKLVTVEPNKDVFIIYSLKPGFSDKDIQWCFAAEYSCYQDRIQLISSPARIFKSL